MSETATANSSSTGHTLLGPFLGHVTTNSIKIWLHCEGPFEAVYITLHSTKLDGPEVAEATLTLRPESLFTDCVTVEGLRPNTKYFYMLWTNPEHTLLSPLEGLEETEPRFWTLSDNPDEQSEFLVMSCHNPTVSEADGYNGHAVWADLPQIIARESTAKVRFALLVGDQVYADDKENEILAEESAEGRVTLYLNVYRRFASNIHSPRSLGHHPGQGVRHILGRNLQISKKHQAEKGKTGRF